MRHILTVIVLGACLLNLTACQSSQRPSATVASADESVAPGTVRKFGCVRIQPENDQYGTIPKTAEIALDAAEMKVHLWIKNGDFKYIAAFDQYLKDVLNVDSSGKRGYRYQTDYPHYKAIAFQVDDQMLEGKPGYLYISPFKNGYAVFELQATMQCK